MRCRAPLSFLLLLAMLFAGCSGPQLAPTPNLFLSGQDDTFDQVSETFQSNRIAVMYLTDRQRQDQPDGSTAYGYGRSNSLAFGRVIVRIGDEQTTWEDVVAASRTSRRTRSMPIKVEDVREIARGPDTHRPLVQVNGELVPNEEMLAAQVASRDAIQTYLGGWIDAANGSDVYLFVHGYNNSFEDAVFRIATIWHYIGRTGVPIAYTWPAGRGGLGGYAYDRESGEFTVSHLKNVLRGIASMPELERLHIIAHSRGTDVVVTALRELFIEFKAQDRSVREDLRLVNLILAAADIDYQVFEQRVLGESMTDITDRLTIYSSDDDKALGLAQWLFSSVSRLGDLLGREMETSDRARLANAPRTQIIEVDVKHDFLGHGYFASNPNVLSDLIRILRDNRPPGAEHGRPLDYDGATWTLREGYLLPED